MSPSVARKSPMGRRSSRRSVSSDEDSGSPPRRRERSPVVKSRNSRSPPRRNQSPRHKSSRKDRGCSPVRERNSSRGKSPKRDKSSSPVSRSPSPRTKRLKRVQPESEVGRAPEKEYDRNHGKGSDKSSKHERSHRERDVEKVSEERRERRSERERDRGSGRDRDRETVTEREKGTGRERDRETVTERERGTGRERNRETVTERDREAVKSRDRDAADRPSSRSRHRRSESPSEVHHHHSRHRSRSPRPASRSRARDEDDDSRRAEHRGDVANDSVVMMKAAEEALETKEKQKPSFELSGTLAAETNRVRGITLLFDEPPDARKPDIRWRLYVFKGGEVLNEPLYVHRQSCYLFGRERRIADIPTDHPSCSKQHAVLQYRQVEEEQPDGTMSKVVRPYLMDLGSTNKTFINDSPLEARRYYELREKDTIKFGNSSREYVLLHENSHH